jgi:type I restriction enzyme S subunit
LHVALPPTLEEQRAIVAWVRRKTEALTKEITRAQSEIELVREYRTRLIADVVTGKVDVRGLAPTEPLPAEPEADADIDDETVPEDTETEPGEEVPNDVD